MMGKHHEVRGLQRLAFTVLFLAIAAPLAIWLMTSQTVKGSAPAVGISKLSNVLGK